jgi:hypothetical protein
MDSPHLAPKPEAIMFLRNRRKLAKPDSACRKVRPTLEVLEDRTVPSTGVPVSAIPPMPDLPFYAMHIHPHLTIFINGQEQVIPALIGLTPAGWEPLHTHDTSGTIHVESPVVQDFHLSDFFAIWGQPFDSQVILNHRADAAHPVTMTVNGQPSNAYGNLVLHDLDNIVISVDGPNLLNAFNVANGVTHSAENLRNTVAQSYQTFLQRQPDQAGADFWVSVMQQGVTDEQLAAVLVSSPEYFALHGGDNSDWVKAMYQDLLGRPADDAGLAYWLGLLQAGQSPTSLALAIASSPEREAQIISQDYTTYLGRSANTDEMAYWVGAFEQGANNEAIVAALVSSTEYFDGSAKGQADSATWVRSIYQDVLHHSLDDAYVIVLTTYLWSS